jgi:2-methylisocitrate lyase-like PEP mutase family enzyme
LLCEKISAVKRMTHDAGLFVNARADVYLRELTPEAQALRESMDRIELYAQAGADGVFVPGVVRAGDIASLVQSVARPLNVLAVAGLPSLAELQRLGVRRVSAGALGAKLAYGTALAATQRFLENADASEFFSGDSLDYTETNRIFTRE